MKCIKSLLPLLLLPYLASCAFVHSLDNNIDQKVAQWIEQKDYAQAQQVLAHIKPGHKKYRQLQQLKVKLDKAVSEYQQTVIAETNQYLQAKQWNMAQQMLAEALQRLPQNAALLAAQQTFVQKRQAYITNLRYLLAMNKAEWLLKNHDIERELSTTEPDTKQAQRQLSEHQTAVRYTYNELLECATDSVKQQKLELAEQCYLLADSLYPSGTLQTAILDIQKRMDVVPAPQPESYSPKTRQLLHSGQHALQNNKLKNAIDSYKNISSKDKQLPQIVEFKTALDQHIKKTVQQGMALGRKLYSQGEIERALAIWSNLQGLDPENQYLLGHIQRAQKVLKKLKQLKKDNNVVTPPSNG